MKKWRNDEMKNENENEMTMKNEQARVAGYLTRSESKVGLQKTAIYASSAHACSSCYDKHQTGN